MALPLVPALVAAVSGLFFRRVTTTDADGNESERRKARPVPAALFALLVFLMLYHFLVWPVLNYHFPEYGFPPLDLAAIGAALTAAGGV